MGSLFSFINQTYPPKSHWTANDMPDLTGKVVIVTGGNSGIGKETCKALLSKNAKVYMAARSKAKAEAAISQLKEETGKEAILLQLDLANLAAVKRAAEEFKKHETKLDVLFNNGGIMAPPIEVLTDDGYDVQFGTNVLGHFYFTRLLIPLLLAGARESPDKKARVVNTSSSGAMFHPHIDWDTLAEGPARTKKGTQGLYMQSKYGNVVFAQELARKYGNEGIVSTSLNPGNIKTDLQRNLQGLTSAMVNLILQPVEMGAVTQLWAGTSPEGVDFNGKYLIPWARIGPMPYGAEDPVVGQKLWDWLEEQVKAV
ncbi:hypothetical protein BOTBODRAFT_35698 [Botryobasidium botryosum FD-172 SS1]|uniref:NAD(P)-binding protein n=1 Tax=Botryobasidium botryosum (strain FD-172 SS1) TaxID=930990 RepID=A0A067M5V5_BOTB1|nr:hypothetical protein BOTBODRAFT_35698 [Botryobasidium botryosum FD-172 SS1]